MDQINSNVPAEEAPVIHGPEDLGGKTLLEEHPRRTGRVIAVVAAVAAGLTLGGGVLYAWYRFQPAAVVGDAYRQLQSRQYYGYDLEMKTSVGGRARTRGSMDAITLEMHGEVDVVKKASANTVFMRIRDGSDSYAFEAEIRVIDEGKTVYIKVSDAPEELAAALPALMGQWIKIGGDPSQLAAEFSQLGGGLLAPPAAQEQAVPSQESLDRLKERLTAIVADPASYTITGDRPWWQAIGANSVRHYTVMMREEAAAAYISAFAKASPEAFGKALTPEMKKSSVEIISRAKVELWIEGQERVINQARATIAPPDNSPASEPIVFDIRLREVRAMAAIEAPPASTDLLQMLAGALFSGLSRSGQDANAARAKDSDGDGVSDYDESILYQSDPWRADTDSDGYADGEEVKNGYNPNGSGPLVLMDALSVARMQARDSKRVSDIKQIQTALELYYSDHSGYPLAPVTLTLGSASAQCLGQSGFGTLGCPVPYMGMIPANPAPGGTPYAYTAAAPARYEIIFTLEKGVGGLPAGPIRANESGLSPLTPPQLPPAPFETPQTGFVPSQLDQALDNTQKQRDEKRIADIIQIQTALELYYSDQSAYPALAGSVTLGEGNFGCLSSRGFFPAGLCKEIIYMGKIPPNPQPGGGPYRYTYYSRDQYEIRFWLEGGARSLPAGEIIASQDGIKPASVQP